MAGGRIRLGLAAILALALAGWLAAPAGADPAPPAALASFDVSTLSPSYGPQVHDYVVRCNNRAVTVRSHAFPPWKVAVAEHPAQSGDHTFVVPLRAGRDFTVTSSRREASSSTATTCAACRATSPPTPSPRAGRCRRSSSRRTMPSRRSADRYAIDLRQPRRADLVVPRSRWRGPGCCPTATSSGFGRMARPVSSRSAASTGAWSAPSAPPPASR